MVSDPRAVWVLLGAKQGDNAQTIALAEALGLPFRVVQLRFNWRHHLSPMLLGPSRCNLTNREALCAPWPQLVISSGRRSVAAARWIRAQAGPHCRSIHVGRPWGPCQWFDLIVTTPQYGVPVASNVQHNLLPLLAPVPLVADTPTLSERFARLPRPWTAVLLGGNSRPLVMTPDVVQVLALQLDREQAACGGSLILVASPRTPEACLKAMQHCLQGSHAVYAWGEADNPYQALRSKADRFVVTDDSVQMVSELLISGRPLQVFPLPERPDPLLRLVRLWRDAAQRRKWLRPGFEWARRNGFLSSLRSIPRFHRKLAAAGAYAHPARAREIQQAELSVTVERIRGLLREAQSMPAAGDGFAPLRLRVQAAAAASDTP